MKKKSLTWEQAKIVSHEHGHALIKAVPGSGKTTTLVKRVERLVKAGVDRRSILILQYNKSAQLSFKNKLKIALNSDDVPEVRTFHSLAFEIVRRGEKQKIIKRKTLLRPEDPRYSNLINEAYQAGFDQGSGYIPINDIEDLELFISRCRAKAVSPQDVMADPIFADEKPEYIRAFTRYCELLEENRLRTFDEYLIESASLLRSTQQIIENFRHIIIDEYQDVNLVQHEMIRFLATEETSVMAVGDLNQCIYEWRGARPDFIGGLFERHFKQTTVFHLSCTFRFGHTLSLMANSVIKRNSTKLERLCVSHPSTPKTEVTLRFDNCLSKVLPSISEFDGSIAILSRTNASLAEAEIALRLAGVPYCYLDGKSSALAKRREVGVLVVGVLLCLYGNLNELVSHPDKRALIFGFLWGADFRFEKGKFNEALNGIMARDADMWAVLEGSISASSEQKELVRALINLCDKDREETPAAEVLAHLRLSGLIDGVGAGTAIRTRSNDEKRGVVRIEDLLASSKIDARTFLDLILYTEQPSEGSDPLVLSTLHGSKGMEWDNVVVIGLEDEEFPGGKLRDDFKAIELEYEPITEDEIQEERRLFYVGITRAKRQLTLVVPEDEGLNRWLNNSWDSTPRKPPIATRFVYEAGLTASTSTSKVIYECITPAQQSGMSGFHQWYLKDLRRLKV
ncbi:MAG: ATP-dependent helicase [Zhongshania sp.]|jgi:DNA helicase-2/ATP-dependent DNA helicase PcrA|nr:ATP-dependent helicase [Zhongshania sp.]